MTPHIEAKLGEIAKTVIMPGDPMRAKFIAENFLTDYKLVNKVRGIFAYTGYYNNKQVTIMASGMGMPSMGIYCYELYKFYDVENIIRIGTAGSYTTDLNLYDLLLVESAYSKTSFGTVQDENASDTVYSSESLNNMIKTKASELNQKLVCGKIHSTDVFYNDNDNLEELTNIGCLAAEMESYALFFTANKLNKQATAILTISDNIVTKEQTTSNDRETKLIDMIRLVLEAI